jgi:hypothetical protein
VLLEVRVRVRVREVQAGIQSVIQPTLRVNLVLGDLRVKVRSLRLE